MLNFCFIYAQNNEEIPQAVLSRFIDQENNQVLFDCTKAVYLLSADKNRLALFYGDKDLNKNLAYDPSKKLYSFFDGVILHNGKYTDDITDLVKTSETFDHFNTCGNYCAGTFCEHGTHFIHQTVLGAYHLFWGKTEELFVVSNNPHLVAHSLKQSEIPKTNYKSFLSLLNYEVSSWGLETVYEGVYFFPINAGLIVHENNYIEFSTLTDKLYQPINDEDFDAEFDKAYDNLLQSIKAIAKINKKNLYGSITGGVDSRTTLSLIKNANIEDRFSFRVFGVPEHPDVQVAQKIAKKINLPLMVKDIQDVKLDPKTYEENMVKNMFFCYASANISQMGENKKKQTPMTCRATGILGELFRSFIYGYKFVKEGKNCAENIRKLLKNSACREDVEEIQTKAFVDIFKHFSNANNFSLPYIWALEIRIHGGTNQRNQIHFLYNTAMHNLAAASHWKFRNAGHLNFKIIERACPALLKVPFADNSWDKFNYENRPDANEFQQIKPVVCDSPMPVVYVAHQKLEILKDYLLHPDEDIFEYFDEKKYWALVDGYIKQNTQTANYKLLNLLSASFWTRNLKNGNICAETTSPVCTELKKDELPKKESFFSLSDYGKILFTPNEVLRENYLALMSKDIPFMKTYLSEQQIKKVFSSSYARIDIIGKRKKDQNLCLKVFDALDNCQLNTPKWIQDGNADGASCQGNINEALLQIECLLDNQIEIYLRGMDVRNADNTRKEEWVKYTSLQINGKEVLQNPVTVWHDQPFKHSVNMLAGEKITLQIKWE